MNLIFQLNKNKLVLKFEITLWSLQIQIGHFNVQKI